MGALRSQPHLRKESKTSWPCPVPQGIKGQRLVETLWANVVAIEWRIVVADFMAIVEM